MLWRHTGCIAAGVASVAVDPVPRQPGCIASPCSGPGRGGAHIRCTAPQTGTAAVGTPHGRPRGCTLLPLNTVASAAPWKIWHEWTMNRLSCANLSRIRQGKDQDVQGEWRARVGAGTAAHAVEQLLSSLGIGNTPPAPALLWQWAGHPQVAASLQLASLHRHLCHLARCPAASRCPPQCCSNTLDVIGPFIACS